MSLYAAHLAAMLAIYMILAASLNLLAGFGGMVSAAHAAFFGIGAYAFAWSATTARAPFLLSMMMGILVAVAVAVMVGPVCVRLRGDHFLLATVAIHLIVQGVVSNWISVTGGPYGISGIPTPALFGLSGHHAVVETLISGIGAAISLLVLTVLLRAPFTRMLQAVRDDEFAAAALGKNPSGVRQRAFVVAAAFAGLAGGLYASTIKYVDPHAFSLDESLFLIAILVVGGAGSIKGPFVGTLVLFFLPEMLRVIPITSASVAPIRQIMLGAILVVCMRARPQGLVGRYGFD